MKLPVLATDPFHTAKEAWRYTQPLSHPMQSAAEVADDVHWPKIRVLRSAYAICRKESRRRFRNGRCSSSPARRLRVGLGCSGTASSSCRPGRTAGLLCLGRNDAIPQAAAISAYFLQRLSSPGVAAVFAGGVRGAIRPGPKVRSWFINPAAAAVGTRRRARGCSRHVGGRKQQYKQ